MTTNNHTPIPASSAATTAVLNAPLADLDAAIGDPSTIGVTNNDNVSGAIGAAALRTSQTNSVIAAVNSVFDDAAAAAAAAAAAQSTANTVTAEVSAARGGYSDLDARIDAIAIAGSGVSTLTNGATSAAQKVIVVDSTTGILAGALISYTLVGGVIQTNTVDTVDSPTQLTVISNVGTGGIADNTYLSMIPVGILMSSGAVVGAVQQMQEFEDGVTISSTTGTTAKWAIKPTSVLFSGVRDEIFWCGWNVNGSSGARIDASEASIYHAIEADYYEVGGGKHYAEWYIEFYSANGAISRRPFATSIDRANGDITNQYFGQHVFNESDGTLAWQIDTGGTLSTPGNSIRSHTNNAPFILQYNVAGTAYYSLIRFDNNDQVRIGDDGNSAWVAEGAGKFGVGTTAQDSKLHVSQEDAGTNGVVGMLTISRNSTGTPAAGFGSRILFELMDSVARDEPCARIDASWNVATNGAVKADLSLVAYDTAAREGLRIRGNGSAPAIGFLGATPIERALLATGAGATVDNVITALQNLGLVKQS